MRNVLTNVRILFIILLLTLIGTVTPAENDINDGDDGLLCLLVDASYTISHGWGHVFTCEVKDVLHGELEDTVIDLSVYGTIELYGDLLQPFEEYQDLMLSFQLDPERQSGPPPGFRDSRNRYWELMIVTPLAVLSPPSSLYEAFPEWGNYEGYAETYEHDTLPKSQYRHYHYPEIDSWISGLKKGGGCYDSTQGCVRIWMDDGKARFIWITNPFPHGGRFYSFAGDTMDMATTTGTGDALFMTEVGIYKWRYIYNEELLERIVYFRTNVLYPIWAVDVVEYWPWTETPRYIYRYLEPDDLDVSNINWDSRTEFDQEGRIIK